MSEENSSINKAELAHRAYSMASEAIQVSRSSAELTDLKFSNMRDQMIDVKKLINDEGKNVGHRFDELAKKIDERFKTLDSRFWSLAMTTITLLVTALIALVVKLLFPHFGQ